LRLVLTPVGLKSEVSQFYQGGLLSGGASLELAPDAARVFDHVVARFSMRLAGGAYGSE
jgi:hypothetical protein